jgi:hypothetical protein
MKCSCGKKNCSCGGKHSKVLKAKYAAGGAVSSSPRPESRSRNSNTVTDPKTGQTHNRPDYSATSVRGLTSNDPANVARNREGAARYSNAGNDRDGRTVVGTDMGAGKNTAGASATPAPAPRPRHPIVEKWMGQGAMASKYLSGSGGAGARAGRGGDAFVRMGKTFADLFKRKP